MKGRIFNIKKSSILKITFVLAFILFCLSTIFFIFFSDTKDFWFFAFLIEIGVCVWLRGTFFDIDSSFYFGLLMTIIGSFYFYCFYFKILNFFSSFILLSLSFSSLLTFAKYKNNLHAKSFVLFLLCSLFTFFLQINVIPVAFFVAIIIFSVIIFILSTTC